MIPETANRTEQKIYSNKGNVAVLSEVNGQNLLILDVGCGGGDNSRVLVNNGHTTDGITLSESEAAICKTFMRHVFIHNLETGLPALTPKSYDYVICSHVLEHIGYPNQLLSDIRNVLKNEGRLIVALPNVMHYQSRIKLLLGKFDYEESGIWDNTHLRWYTFASGRRLLEENGFEVIKGNVDGDIPLLSVFGFIPRSIRKNLFSFLSFFSKGFFGNQLIYVAKPRA